MHLCQQTATHKWKPPAAGKYNSHPFRYRYLAPRPPCHQRLSGPLKDPILRNSYRIRAKGLRSLDSVWGFVTPHPLGSARVVGGGATSLRSSGCNLLGWRGWGKVDHLPATCSGTTDQSRGLDSPAVLAIEIKAGVNFTRMGGVGVHVERRMQTTFSAT